MDKYILRVNICFSLIKYTSARALHERIQRHNNKRKKESTKKNETYIEILY